MHAASLCRCVNRSACDIIGQKGALQIKEQDWAAIFGDGYVVNLTNGERRCFALDPLDPSWDMQRFCYQSGQRCTRLTVFFSGDTIVKVIDEEICVRPARGRMGEA